MTQPSLTGRLTRRGLLALLGLGAAAGCSPSAPASPTLAASSPAASSSSAATASPTPTPTPTPSPSPTPTPTPVAAPPPPPWAGVADPLPAGPVNVLIYGTDNNSDSGNADVLVVAQLSADRTRVTLVGVPRDSYVRLATGGSDKINSALMRGGVDGLKRTVSNLFGGLPIHYVAHTNFRDFIKLCNLLSGFWVVNKIASSVTSMVTGKVTRFPAGQLTLYGADWLIYARQRHGLPLGEFDRGQRHRAIVTGMLKGLQYLAEAQPIRLATIAAGVFSCVRISGGITPANILGLVPTLQRITTIATLRVPTAGYGSHGAVKDTVELDFGLLARLSASLRAGTPADYVARVGGD